MKVRAIGINYEVALWLEKKQPTMRALFSGHIKKTKRRNKKLKKFITEFNGVMEANGVCKQLIASINQNLSSFGPFRHGPNIFLNMLIPPEMSLLNSTLPAK